MKRGQKKSIDDKSVDKEKLIDSIKVKLKSEQAEFEELHNNKRNQELTSIVKLLQKYELNPSDLNEILQKHFTKAV